MFDKDTQKHVKLSHLRNLGYTQDILLSINSE